METNYLLRLVLANETRMMIASPAKTRGDVSGQAIGLMETLGAKDVEIWNAHTHELVMEIESK